MNYSEIALNGTWQISDASNVKNYGDVISYGVADSVAIGTEIMPTIGYLQTHWCSCCCSHYHLTPTKSAREQVIEEIMTKMAEAVSKDDFKQAKKLAQLAKAVKEL
jgi:hypothetical protein